jgi:hypothetical protein
MGSQRDTHDEIYTDVFPLPGRSIQRLQQIGRSEMICLEPLTSVTFYNIASSLMLYFCPPELHFQVMVHLGAARVNRNLTYELHQRFSFAAPGYVEQLFDH